ncbi:ABC transporter B family member 4 [Dendrobium catenatum]|uniref:ABC transporter B family member 4 n=1 Tax=Dendrobium catenatum TaxID=906689 RepID=UPI00109F0169|nr:ABC transporter B family member 4 [Dendrobium catenatum]
MGNISYGKDNATMKRNQSAAELANGFSRFINKMPQIEQILRKEMASIEGEERGAKKKEEKSSSLPFYRLFGLADSIDIILMILGTAGAIANGAAMPICMLLGGKITDSYGAGDVNDVVHRVSKLTLQMFYMAIGSGLASFLQVTCWMVTGERQTARIRSIYFKAILKQEIAFFDLEISTGEVIERMSGDIILIQEAMGEQVFILTEFIVGKFINLISTFLIAFVVSFVEGWLLTLIMLSTIPPMVVCGAIMAIVLSKMSSNEQKSYIKASEIVEQTISSIRTVASFTGEKLAMQKYKKALNGAYISCIYEGLTTGLGAGLTYRLEICRALGQASPCLKAFSAGQAAAYRIFEIINRKPEIDAYDSTGKQLDDIHGDIEFKEVYFSYPTRPDEQIFQGFSLFIHSGTTIALVGESGSGKSTLISLIERFYDPQAGEILIDGINIKHFQLRWLRGRIGIVSQEPILFTSTIGENISYGKDNATIEEIRAAAELANASRFINKMPQGLDTMVGEHGSQLSGGQKQRIALARAILKDPKILLLDEATSALDVESEQIVQEAIDSFMLNRTTIIVAHRLSAVRKADTIAVMHQGSIVEKGSASELVKNPNGAYSKLIKLQKMNRCSDKTSVLEDRTNSLFKETRSKSHRMSFKEEISRESTIGKISKRYSFNVELGESSLIHSSRHHTFKLEPEESSPGLGGSSRRYSFKIGLGVPLEIKVQGGTSEELKTTIPDDKTNDVPLRQLVCLNKPEIPVLLIGSVAAIINGVVFPVLGIMLSSMMVIFYEPPHKMKKDSKFWSLMFLVIAVVSLLAVQARSYFFALAGSKLIRRIRMMTFEKVVNMEMAWFDDPENFSGEVGSRLSTDAAKVRSIVGDRLGLYVQNAASLIAGLIIAFAASWEISLIVLGVVPLVGLNAWIQIKFIKGFSADAEVCLNMFLGASQVTNDAVGNIRTVVSFSAEEKVVELYKKKCDDPMRLGIRQGVISGIGFGISQLFLYSAYATILYMGARLVHDGKSTFEKVFRIFSSNLNYKMLVYDPYVATIILFIYCLIPWNEILQAFYVLVIATVGIFQSNSQGPDSSKARAATASIFALINRESKIDPSIDSGKTLEVVKGNIKFNHVSFRYPTRPDIQIFQDMCLEVQAGKSIALVGESGSGKSTAIALLQRFYDPDSGHISVDGIDLHQFQLRWLRQQMGLVSQEPVLFNDTIHANIAYGNQDGKATQAEIIVAAELANAHNFICSLQQGYDTMVGARGVQLSGGQKQRIAIARAILKKPKILLLDEATSALDAESEKVVQDALDQIMINRTTITVTHRLTSIKNNSFIAVVKNGKIVEKGKHDVLSNNKDGVYAAMIAFHANASP